MCIIPPCLIRSLSLLLTSSRVLSKISNKQKMSSSSSPHNKHRQGHVVDNMIMLEDVSERGILNNLKEMYKKDHIYVSFSLSGVFNVKLANRPSLEKYWFQSIHSNNWTFTLSTSWRNTDHIIHSNYHLTSILLLKVPIVTWFLNVNHNPLSFQENLVQVSCLIIDWCDHNHACHWIWMNLITNNR